MKDENGQPYSDEYLRDLVINFMIAGRDTTAVALTWLFYELGKNPEWEQRWLMFMCMYMYAQQS